jgi:hypothetical protein
LAGSIARRPSLPSGSTSVANAVSAAARSSGAALTRPRPLRPPLERGEAVGEGSGQQRGAVRPGSWGATARHRPPGRRRGRRRRILRWT